MSQATKTKNKRHGKARVRQGRRPASGARPVHTAKRTPRRRRRKLSPMVAVGATVVALGMVAAILSLGGGGGDAPPSWAAVEIDGGSLPSFARAAGDPAIGMKAPVVRGTDFGGGEVVIAPTGRPQVVVFLAHWCPHCRNDVPALVSWWKDHGMVEGVDVYAVSTWADASKPNFPPGRWLREEGWPVPTLVDDKDSSVGRAFGLHGTPFWVFLDETGRVAGRLEAELGGAGLERALEMLGAQASTEPAG